MLFDGSGYRISAVTGLAVRYPLLGSTHSFVVNETAVSVRLPKPEYRRSCSFYRGIATEANDSPNSWWAIDQVEVLCELPKISYPGEDGAPFDLRIVEKLPRLEEMRLQVPDLLSLALNNWLRTMRWILRSSAPQSNEDGSKVDRFVGDFKVFRNSDDAIFYQTGGIVKFSKLACLDFDDWEKIDKALQEPDGPPLWIDLLSTAEVRLKEGSLGEAIIGAAMACETVIRAVFWTHVPNVTNSTAFNAIDNVSVQSLLAKWGDLTGLGKAQVNAMKKSEMHDLFDLRNAVVHKGKQESLDSVKVKKVLSATRTFVEEAERVRSSLLDAIG